jgi:Uma2 family endonuclease
MASKIEPLLTVADLDAFPEDDGNRYELIGGELFVSCAPGIPHQRVLLNLEIGLSDYLKTNPIGILVPGAGVIFSDYDAVIPNLAFVRHERWDQVVTGEKFTGALDIVIEILSPGSQNRRRDLSAKRKLYGQYGVAEYWIVDSEKSVGLDLSFTRANLGRGRYSSSRRRTFIADPSRVSTQSQRHLQSLAISNLSKQVRCDDEQISTHPGDALCRAGLPAVRPRAYLAEITSDYLRRA